jgi:hypothetical protein
MRTTRSDFRGRALPWWYLLHRPFRLDGNRQYVSPVSPGWSVAQSTAQFCRSADIGEAFIRPYQSADRIAANPDYGRIICHCERVTRAEILDATHAIIPARSLDAVRRRTRALLGRCQGFFCLAEVAALVADATGQPVARLLGVEQTEENPERLTAEDAEDRGADQLQRPN